MNPVKFTKYAGLAFLLAVSTLASAATVVKAPDLGNYWSPLSSSGTYTYANSFVAPVTGTITELGAWLSGGSSNLQYKVFGSIGGNASLGPDANALFASTNVMPGMSLGSLTFIDATSGISGGTVIAGTTYWFAATTVGLGGSGSYNVGGHTQNSGLIVDNGTFWYSNDPSGVNFDGQRLPPEMAFSVSVAAVPEPETYGMLLAGLGLLGFVLRRKAS
ncbi:PEP-CTERM sorting domain-containing protein [Janthinobacterium sp.]|uniref:PEP-CTERM sorting domain-containing protein n=1 Tax=Janthinobacterium sp. TaxID=1871054 RepID=UPI00293D4C9A|nr:PEP-CTERM sorting domain-containing protein [Janthinobacterium sp.]